MQNVCTLDPHVEVFDLLKQHCVLSHGDSRYAWRTPRFLTKDVPWHVPCKTVLGAQNIAMEKTKWFNKCVYFILFLGLGSALPEVPLELAVIQALLQQETMELAEVKPHFVG